MSSKRLLFVLATLALVISSCKQQYQPSQNQSANATPTIFDNSLPDDFNLENRVDEIKTTTALAAGAGGPTNTPNPQNLITFTPTFTPNAGGPTSTPTATLAPGVVCTAPACSAGQTLVCPSGNCPNACGLVCSGVTATLTAAPPVPPGVRPATYTLHEGEFPYCIARRYDVDPIQLLQLSGLAEGALYTAGTNLKIPQSGFFPGTRALIPHPATYTVTSSEETFYSIACLYGDPYPERIAQVNNLPVSAILTAGQKISIP